MNFSGYAYGDNGAPLDRAVVQAFTDPNGCSGFVNTKADGSFALQTSCVYNVDAPPSSISLVATDIVTGRAKLSTPLPFKDGATYTDVNLGSTQDTTPTSVTVSGTVSSASGPVNGASVKVEGSTSTSYVFATTGPDGKYTLSFQVPHLAGFEVYAWSDLGWARRTFNPGTSGNLDAAFSVRPTIATGTVKTTDGRPVGGLTVEALSRSFCGRAGSCLTSRRTVSTASNGAYRLEYVPCVFDGCDGSSFIAARHSDGYTLAQSPELRGYGPFEVNPAVPADSTPSPSPEPTSPPTSSPVCGARGDRCAGRLLAGFERSEGGFWKAGGQVNGPFRLEEWASHGRRSLKANVDLGDRDDIFLYSRTNQDLSRFKSLGATARMAPWTVGGSGTQARLYVKVGRGFTFVPGDYVKVDSAGERLTFDLTGLGKRTLRHVREIGVQFRGADDSEGRTAVYLDDVRGVRK